MPVEIHVQRRSNRGPIRPKEWEAAVKATSGVRLKADDWIAKDPASGEVVITLPCNPLDTEVFFEDQGRWIGVFRCTELRSGKLKISARHTVMFEEPVRAALRELTKVLGAVVEGDSGETYDLVTGEPL